MTRFKSLYWLIPLLAALGVLVWFGFNWWRGPQVEAIEMRLSPLVRTLQFSARVASQSRVDVGSTVTGRVAQVLVKEGAQVQAGDVLIQLENAEWKAALEQARASEKQASARLAGLRNSGRIAAQASLGQAQATERNTQSAWVRAQKLVEQGFFSAAQADEARRAATVAQEQVRSARAQVQANANGGTDLAQAQAQLDVARAATTAAQARLDQATVRTPTDARVLLRNVEPGQIVQPGKALMSLALKGPTQLVAQVDERFLEQLRLGQTAVALADAFPTQRFTARVMSLAPAVDAQRGAIEVKFGLEGTTPDFLREDMTLSVEVQTAKIESALVLPQSALRKSKGESDGERQSADVLVVVNSHAEVRNVRLGLHTLGAVQVQSGLSEGDIVLRDGASVESGKRVRPMITKWQPSGAGMSAPGEDAGAALTGAMGR